MSAALALGFVALQRNREARLEDLRRHALSRGWGFRDTADPGAIPGLDRFELFDQGRHRRITAVATSPDAEPRMVVFDYSYVTGGGNSRRTHRQTVFYAAGEFGLPRFTLRPEHFLHRVAERFGYQDIDLDRHPTFSSMFVLRGEDEASVRDAFGDDVVAFFLRQPRICAAGAGSELLLWTPRTRLDAAGRDALLRDGRELAAIVHGSPRM